VARPLERHVQ